MLTRNETAKNIVKLQAKVPEIFNDFITEATLFKSLIQRNDEAKNQNSHLLSAFSAFEQLATNVEARIVSSILGQSTFPFAEVKDGLSKMNSLNIRLEEAIKEFLKNPGHIRETTLNENLYRSGTIQIKTQVLKTLTESTEKMYPMALAMPEAPADNRRDGQGWEDLSVEQYQPGM